MLRPSPKSRALAILLILFLLIGQLGYSPSPALAANTPAKNSTVLLGSFKDVAKTNPNFVFINYLNKRGLLNGFSDGTFKPAAGLTRSEAAAVLVKAAGLRTGPAKTVFRDVPAKHWAAASIAAAKAAQLLNGYPDGTFRPNAKLTRAEGISVLLKLSKQSDPGVDLPVLADMTPGHWAAKPAAVGLASEMIGLSSDNKYFLPNAPLTRGSLARALAVLITRDPALYETGLTEKLYVKSGSVSVVRSGSKTVETVNGSTTLQPGDMVNTGPTGLADITFPDGTGLRLENSSQFALKETKGRSYIKPDGTPGTAVERLVVELTIGKMFGALATSAEANAESTGAQARAVSLARIMGHTSEKRIRTAAASAKPLPWWKQSGVKRTKVTVDMPTGVAAIRGTFWENIVNSDGSFDTTLLTGSAEITAGGQTVDLTGGQRTEVTSTGAPPAPPAPLTTEDKHEWFKEKEWAQQRAEEIAVQQETSPTIQDIDKLINDALAQITDEITLPPSSGSESEASSAIRVTGIKLNTHSAALISGSSPITVTAQVYPGNASNNSITWTSSNSSVASVANGVITPLSAGTATITVTTFDGGFTDSCAVTVTSPAGGTGTASTFRVKSVERASVSYNGSQAADSSGGGEAPSAVSGGGRYIAFFSYANNLVPGDTNNATDIFVRDRVYGTTVRVSVDSNGIQGNSGSRFPGISANGRYVVFSSGASNLVTGDTNGAEDIFVHDRDADNDGVFDEPGGISTTRVDVATDGTQANYGSYNNSPSISADGRYITFYSDATTLVPRGTDTNGVYDVFVRDTLAGTTQLVSVSTAGIQANAACYYPFISPNGRFIAYTSSSTTLVPGVITYGIFVRDLVYNTTTYLTNGSDPVMSFDGRYVAYSNGNDIYVRDRDKNSTGVFDQTYQDTKLTVTTDNNMINGSTYKPSISDDGQYVAFTSHATNLVTGDSNGKSDIFVCDTVNMVLKRVSAPLAGGEANQSSWYQAMSADGKVIAFTSEATNLVAGDTNAKQDVFDISLELNSPPDTTPPTSPAGLHSLNSGPYWISLSWSPATDANNIVQYSIWRSTSLTGGFSKIASVYGNVYSYWDSGLLSATPYYYYVLAQDEDGNVSAVPSPVRIDTPAEAAAAIAAGYRYSMARLNDGSIWGWGQNNYGSLGINTTINTSTPEQTVNSGVYFTGVAAMDAYNHTLALKNDGTVWAWGDNRYGQLGIDSSTVNSPTPIQVSGLTNIKAVAAGEFHSLALGSDGTVWSWGTNDKGQLGNRSGIINNCYTPVQVVSPDGTGYLTNIVAIASGYETSLALKSDGTVWAWGFNNWGDLGLGTYDNNPHPVPVQVPGLTDIIAIAGGYDHYLALKKDGTVWAWGTNSSGELGNEPRQDRLFMSPVQVRDTNDTSGFLTGVTSIAAGWYHNLALKSNGSLWAWGSNYYQQLGNNAWVNQSTPVLVLGPGQTGTLSGVIAIAADFNHSLAITSNGSVFDWGYNDCGQLGDGTTTGKGWPIQVSFPALL